jgi:serine/threonine protein kinase
VIVTELLSGGTFSHMVRETKPTEAQLWQWTEQIASALAFMHSLKMQHRDLKPDNVLFSEHGQPKIIDLGLACTLSSKSRVSTKQGGTVGTNLYMSPEKGRGKSYVGRDDVWALGIMLAGGVIGTPLEDQENINAVGIFALNRSGVDKLVKEAQAANASLGKVVEAMLAQNALKRATAQQVVDALRNPGSKIGPSIVALEEEEEDDDEEAATKATIAAAERARREAQARLAAAEAQAKLDAAERARREAAEKARREAAEKARREPGGGQGSAAAAAADTAGAADACPRCHSGDLARREVGIRPSSG